MSSVLSARGFIIHRMPFGNTSQILRCVTQEEGRFSLMAKGSLRPKSSFLGAIDLFYYVDILYCRSRTSHLHSLREIKMLQPNLGLRQSYETFLTIHYFAELVEAITEPDTPIPREYDLFEKAVAYLNEKPSSPKVIRRYEDRLLEIAGISDSRTMSKQDPLEAGFAQLQARVPTLRSDVRRRINQRDAGPIKNSVTSVTLDPLKTA